MNIIFTARDTEITPKYKDYVDSKLTKLEDLLEKATKINAELSCVQPKGDGLKTYTLEITVFMPNAVIRVEEVGEEQYSLVDLAEVVLKRRLVRYHDKLSSFKNEIPWKRIEDDGEEAGNAIDIPTLSTEFEPVIIRYKEYSDNTPMHITEAVERMELLGQPAFLFRNIDSGKYSMVYKRDDGNYGLIEPKEG